MITKEQIEKFQNEDKTYPDRELLLLAQKEGCYYLACIWQNIDPGPTISELPEKGSKFSEDNPFVHLYRRYIK